LLGGSAFLAQRMSADDLAQIVNVFMRPVAAAGDLNGAVLAGISPVDSGLQSGETPTTPGELLAGPTALPPSPEGVALRRFAHIWTAATVASAEQIADAIRARTKAEVAVVSWPSGLGHADTADARTDAITIINTWGVGRRGVDDGLVVLFDMDTSNEHGQIYL